MKRIIITALLMTAFLAQFGSGRAGAQQAKEQAGKERAASGPAATPERPVAPLRRDFKDSFPIPPGEKLEYEVRVSRFPIYASLGVLTFANLGAVAPPQGSGPTTPATEDQQKTPDPVSTVQWIEGLNMEFRPSPDEQLWRLRATAVSKGMFVSMLGFDANYRFETLVDMRDF